MTAPKLERMKFWIVKPKVGTNQIKNPRFDTPDGVEDWTAVGAGVTIESSSAYQRWGAYSMKVNTASGVASAAYHVVSVTSGWNYTFSCYVKCYPGENLVISIRDASGVTIKSSATAKATGYWQRVETTWLADATATNYRVYIVRGSQYVTTNPFYVDGAQFEQATKATTLIHGYAEGCRWTGGARNSPSERSGITGLGGELLCINDYARVISVHGLGMGDWNQVMTKMTSGGDMYQTHIRKSRNFSMVLAYTGDNQGDMQANRKVIIDALRPDYLFGSEDERRIIRYQGFDSNGDEATNPVDIVCVFQPSHTDTPSLPVFQKDVLNFTIPSGLLNGAYNEGAELDWVADFPAEFIVKRDKDGNWCRWTGGAYASLITGLNGGVYCMAEGPDGKIYVGGSFTNAGGVANADYLARWNPFTEVWEAVGNPAFGTEGTGQKIFSLIFDADGNLYAGGNFINAQGVAGADYIAKFDGTNWTALGTGANGYVYSIAIAPNGDVYAGGDFALAGGVANTAKIAKWNGTAWSALATGLNDTVLALAFAPNGDLYIGGLFTNADGTYGDYLCYKRPDENVFKRVGMSELNGNVSALAFDMQGRLYVGGALTAIGSSNISYIARWNGSAWESLGTGTNGAVLRVFIESNKVYACGDFTTAGGLTIADRVAVWSNGAWQPLDINLPGTATVYPILPVSDGSLYIGGAFSTAGETPDENAQCGIISDRIYTIGVTSASANTYPFIQVHGPGTLKSIANYSTGKTIQFDGLTLLAGEYINLQFDPLDLRFYSGWSGRGNLMRYVVPGSDYGDFYLKPGLNALSLFMTGADSNSGAWIQWTPLFWGLDGALL